MTFTRLTLVAAAAFLFASAAFGQITTTVYDPSLELEDVKLTSEVEALMQSDVLPAVRKKLLREGCSDNYNVMGFAEGAFSRAKANQTIIFYQFCETGNGLGDIGLALLEGDKVVGSWVANSGWGQNLKRLPDINRNGLDEFTLAYGGGMHQGEGGIGIDVVELGKNGPRGLGWFQGEIITDTETDWGYRVTVKPGKVPVYYRQKIRSVEGHAWSKVGRNSKFSLKKTTDSFTAVK